mmetsp:Transcript_133433/g.231887  ORF Transcript_133433/g.231887 Transcript_133433/m.231887 type:complete len:408 (-) Transcript_133433:173-1396(-)
MSADWRWVNLAGGHAEELVADLCASGAEGGGIGRGCIVIQTNAMASFHVAFSHTDALPIRGSNNPALRFVVGKRQNSMTSVGLGSPYAKKEPIDFTRSADALLTGDPEKSRTYWFLYDRNIGVAAMGVQVAPQADLCRLVCRFRDSTGFRAEACENVRYIVLSSGKRPVSLRVVNVFAPPDISIPRFRFNPETWSNLSWQGSSCVFELDDFHRYLVERVQDVLKASAIAPYYNFVEPKHFCVNAYRLLDTLRRVELFPGRTSDDLDWRTCHDEVYTRMQPVLSSAPWTFWPLRFDRVDCTAITLASTGTGCGKAISEWCKAMEKATMLRNGATNREMLTLTFAFEVFPVEGENAAQARREVVRCITEILEREWGVMEFRCPQLVCWQTHTEYVPYSVLAAESRALSS